MPQSILTPSPVRRGSSLWRAACRSSRSVDIVLARCGTELCGALVGTHGHLAAGLRGRRIPVEDHLRGKDEVKGEASDEAVQDELVVDFLQGGEDAGEGAGEVIEDLVGLRGTISNADLSTEGREYDVILGMFLEDKN